MGQVRNLGVHHRSLATAEIPSRLEPTSLSRSDGKRPDGITLMQWKQGRCLVWDVTCCDTLANSHLNQWRSHGGRGETRPPYSAETTRGIRAKPESFFYWGVGVEVVMKSSTSRRYFLENN